MINDDKSVNYGTHNELMESSTLYKSIYDLQSSGGGIDENNLVKKSIKHVIKENVISVALLVVIIVGIVITSLLPPQILRKIIDQNLVPRNIAGLLSLAVWYLGILMFIGIFDFVKEAILTILGQITKGNSYGDDGKT